MDATEILRIKSSMLVYSLEKALGSYVLDNEALKDELSNGSINAIVTREANRGNYVASDDTNLIIESSYLDEIFGFALDVSKGTSAETYLKSLKQMCQNLDIFSVRNAVSHANRAFPDSYWYRAAVVCSDPLIEKLGLSQISKSLHAAEQGNLNEPPPSWLYSVKWAIPNNLPKGFDHEITGLLGRENEFKELNKLLSLPRENLIAIVAPGGVGKTALVLQYLKDLSLTPESNKFVDAISYCSLKNEELTANGVEQLEALNGIEAIKENLVESFNDIFDDYNIQSFEDACEKLADKKILICVDNLETLLIDSQDDFLVFNRKLPIFWRVFVTSRISLNSATTVPLDVLGSQHAIYLARNYFKKRGVGTVAQEDVKKIAKSANKNPLAIRLTIDLYLKGHDIPQSISQSQKDIASFSYKNLIDSLTENSVSILETIFAQQNSNRTELSELLDFTFEEVAESVNELSRTSLISRYSDIDEGDSYKLSDSIRDLLLVNPKNIEVRERVQIVIRKRKELLQEHSNRQKQLGVTIYEEEYIEPQTIDSIKLLAVDTNKLLKGNNCPYLKLQELQQRYTDMLNLSNGSYLFCLNFSRVLRELNDHNGELTYLLKAEKIHRASPRVKLAIAYRYFANSDYPKSEPYYFDLLNEGYNKSKNSTTKFAFRVLKGYLQCLLFQGKYPEVIGFTQNWENNDEFRELLGAYKASALKRSVEHSIHSDVDKTSLYISDAIDVLDKVFSLEGHSYIGCYEANKVVKEICHITNSSSSFTKDFIFKCLVFSAKHYFDVIQNLSFLSFESENTQINLKNLYSLDIEHNPMREVSWYQPDRKAIYNADHIKELESEGYKIVTVYHVPDNQSGMSNFMFAKDIEEQQYYLKVDKLNEGWVSWSILDVGCQVAIKYGKPEKNKETKPATEIVMIDIDI
jgi:predicted transcriptional regulator